MSQDRIEKEIVLRAPRARVWRALASAEQFGAWFGARFEGPPFAPGARLVGHVTSKGYEHWTFELNVERMEPEHLLSYRWHPYPEPGKDYTAEPATLVEFRLEEVPEGTRLTVVESGFDRLPPDRRATALRMNDGGWSAQLGNIQRHVST